MIEIIVGIITILFYIYLVFDFFSYTSLFLNIIIITALYFLVTRDLKDTDNHKYYIASLFLTALFFIFSNTGFMQYVLQLENTLLLSLGTVAAFFIYILANAIALFYEGFQHLKEKYKK
ncbi:hypothetical protein HYU50_00975 [Candidatus Woesearchaeota archaeon]|nr:hypothetical protein [Candidatus Woesearchaeota archaeon]